MKKFLTTLLVSILAFFPGLAAALDVGDPAPLFEAISDKGPVKLLEYRGQKNVVLAFYFADFTPV
jgi:peroxiredoxin Q/BCP